MRSVTVVPIESPSRKAPKPPFHKGPSVHVWLHRPIVDVDLLRSESSLGVHGPLRRRLRLQRHLVLPRPIHGVSRPLRGRRGPAAAARRKRLVLRLAIGTSPQRLHGGSQHESSPSLHAIARPAAAGRPLSRGDASGVPLSFLSSPAICCRRKSRPCRASCSRCSAASTTARAF